MSDGGINGLEVSNTQIQIISSNISNASTVGYKSKQPIFFEMSSNSSFDSNENNTSGVGISNVLQNFHDGVLVQTGRNLDLGISQQGFFRVIDSQEHVHYTRDGQFFIDKDKNIVNAQGMRLTGKNQESFNNTFNNNLSYIEAINLKQAQKLKEKSTTEIKLQALLNSKSDILPQTSNDNDSLPHNYTDYINIYKKNGEEEKISISFNKIDNNKWQIQLKSDNSANKDGINSSFELQFNEHGELISDANFNIRSNNSEYDDIKLNLTGTVEKLDVINSLEESFQNGYAAGELITFHISPNGEIIGNYSNEEKKVIGQVLLSKFVTPERLQSVNNNLWLATAESGSEKIGIAGKNGFGIINSEHLEASNVDLNKELINMIIAQRNYQSNVQCFKAQDKLINTLINLR